MLSPALLHHVSPQLVALTSSLNRPVAYPQQEITFTCETKGSHIIAWSSNHYIGGNGAQLELTTATDADHMATSLIDAMTIATLVNITEEDGMTILVSELRIKVLPQYFISSISCHNVGHNTASTSTFQRASESLNNNETLSIRVHVVKVINIGRTQSTFDAAIIEMEPETDSRY